MMKMMMMMVMVPHAVLEFMVNANNSNNGGASVDLLI